MNIAGRYIAHFMQVVLQVFADGIALQVIVVESEQGKGDDDTRDAASKILWLNCRFLFMLSCIRMALEPVLCSTMAFLGHCGGLLQQAG